MPTIRFSHNWNSKLDGQVFTTIRKYEPDKYDYYLGYRGQIFTVMLDNHKVGEAKLVDVFIQDYYEIPELLLRLDTGMVDMLKVKQLFNNFGIKGDDRCIILLFEKVEAKFV